MQHVDPPSVALLFQQEVQSLQQELHRRAARALFRKLHPAEETSVGAFLQRLQEHPVLWEEISSMSAIEFAKHLLGILPADSTETVPRRTRLNEEQKEGLKQVVVNILSSHSQGLSRHDLVAAVPQNFLHELRIETNQLGAKLRQPLLELLREQRITTTGQKRLMRYRLALPDTKSSARIKKTK